MRVLDCLPDSGIINYNLLDFLSNLFSFNTELGDLLKTLLGDLLRTLLGDLFIVLVGVRFTTTDVLELYLPSYFLGFLLLGERHGLSFALLRLMLRGVIFLEDSAL